MARPREPLLSKRKVLAAALSIIDEEGLEHFSVRHLARNLGVNPTSLYHHFEDRAAILAGVVDLVLDSVRTPAKPKGNWRDWLLDNVLTYRAELLAHPNVVPIILQGDPIRIGLRVHESSMERLIQQGVDESGVLSLLELLETIALGNILYSQAKSRSEAKRPDSSAFPLLAAAVVQRQTLDDRYFVSACRGILDAPIWTQR